MNRVIFSLSAIGLAILLSACVTRNAAQMYSGVPLYTAPGEPAYPEAQPLAPAAPNSVFWPVVFNSAAATYTVFEPQSDSWDGHQLVARSAVAVQSSTQSPPAYGVISFSAITLVDKTARTANLADVKITSADFPSAGGQAQTWLASLRREFPGRAQPLSLDRLETALSLAAQHPKTESLNNTPPKIIIATRPAVLVCVDGPPVWRPVPGTGLQRAINTRMLLLQDQSGLYYLHFLDGYLQAASLNGPWMVASQWPDGAKTAEKVALDSGQADLMQGDPAAPAQKLASLTAASTPDVFVAATPSEMITFSGSPGFVAIAGTALLYAANTSGNVFKLLTDQQNYVLTAGRWYRAPSLNGPWQFVPGNQLPRDFANIPDTSPKENVKASVPGTQQAEEALIANSIPQDAAVPRTTQMQDPRIDGAPQLAPIPGTPLNYVVNSATPIIKVDAQSWYACQNGVWYAATSANGPWAVAASVPAVIYSIPTASPLHYLTYVHVYGDAPDAVYEGYTPGYLGTEVADDGTVVYGTGYYYPPWIGSVWYGPPVTWGWGFDDCWTPWWGWGFDCGFGWGWGFGGIGWWGCYPPFPWWGGFRHWHDHDGDGWRDHDRLANTSADIYHNPGRFAANGFNTSGRRGWAGDYGHAYNSRTGWLAAGQHARVQSVYGGAWRPPGRQGFAQNNFFGADGRGALANRGGAFADWRRASPSFQGRNHGGFESRVSGMNRGFHDYSYGSPRGWNGFNASPGSGGWFHGGGGFFHGGGGGSHGGWGGGGGHGGGGHGGGGGGGGGHR